MTERKKRKKLELLIHIIVIFLVYWIADKISAAMGFEKMWQYMVVLLIVVVVGVTVEQLVLSAIKNPAFLGKHLDETEDDE